MPAQPPNGALASEDPPQPAGTGDGGAAADDDQVVLPADPAQLPPDRPRPPEPPGPPPPVPDELPKRRADPSRPSVPSRRSRQPAWAPGAGPPGLPAPHVRPLPPELFRPLWWQERPDQASPPPPSPEPGEPEAGKPDPGRAEPSSSAQSPAAEPSWGTVLATTVGLWLRRQLTWTRRSRPDRPRRLVVVVAGLVAAALLAGATAVALSGRGR